MDVFEKMKEEHRIIINSIVGLIGSDPLTRRNLMNDLIIQILAHMNAEEQSVYKALEGLDAVPRSLAIRYYEEHHIAKVLMNELQDRGIDNEFWAAKLQVFRSIFERHIESEEKTIFDMALDYFAEDEILKIAKEYERIEADLFNKGRIEPIFRA
jgi:hemerythrin-like domain-containing protein